MIADENERGVWMGVGWDTSYADAVRALEHRGVRVERLPPDDIFSKLRANGADFSAQVSFRLDRPYEIVVTYDSVSKHEPAEIAARLKERWGAPRSTGRSIQWRWERPESSTIFVVVTSGGDLLEDHWREYATSGDVGFAGLCWDMSPATVEQTFANAGLDVYVEEGLVSFADEDDREGEVRFDGPGMRTIATWGPLRGREDARANELAMAFGPPKKHEVTTGTSWRVGDTKVELVTREDLVAGCIAVFETYRELDPLLRGHSA